MCVRALLVVLSVGIGFLFAAAPAMTAPAKACQRDVVTTRTKLIKTVVRLEGAKKAEASARCVAYRDYAQQVTKAREVFARCNSGNALDKDVSHMDVALSDLQSVIARSCPEASTQGVGAVN